MTPGKTVADGFHVGCLTFSVLRRNGRIAVQESADPKADFASQEMADAADVIERELDKELRSYRKMLG